MTLRSNGVWPAGLAATNRTAANVVKRGTHFEPKVKPAKGRVHADAPLPTKDYNGPEGSDWTGRRVGRLTVIGSSATVKYSKTAGAAWVVRCDCSKYEIRRTRGLKALLANDPAQACCHACYRAWVLRKRDRRRALGISTAEEEAIIRERAQRCQ
jgi:hypothetical protein